jgi:peptide/nickel transport system substrate-binding protein
LYKYLIIIFFCPILLFSLVSAQNDLKIDKDDYGDRLKIGYVWQGDLSFNPLILRYDYDKEFFNLVFGAGLFTETNDDSIVLNLASKSTKQSQTVLRFELRPNLSFHDGSLITPEDVKLSYELYKKYALQFPRYYSARLINEIEIYGSDIIRFKLIEPIPDFPETIGKLPILPKNICKIWLKYDSLSDLPEIKPIGFGHFKFIEYKQGKYLKLDSFQKHQLGQSYIGGIDFLFFETQDRLLNAFLREEVDLIQINDKSEIQKIIQFSKKIIRVNNKETSLYYLNLNTRNLPFNDIGIRKALNYAINKEQIINHLNNRSGNEGQGDLSARLFNNSQYFKSYDYKPFEALQILLDSRFSKNSQGKLFRNQEELEFELYIEKGSLFEESIARIIAINLGDIGIKVLPLSINPAELNKKILQGQYQAALRKFNFNPNLDDVTLRDFYFNELNNQNGFQNFKNLNTELLFQLARISTDKKSVATISKSFQNLINRFSPCIYLFVEESEIYAINPRFENVYTATNSSIEMLKLLKPKHEWFVKKDNHRY